MSGQDSAQLADHLAIMTSNLYQIRHRALRRMRSILCAAAAAPAGDERRSSRLGGQRCSQMLIQSGTKVTANG